jgi:hypothetical protein
MAAESPNCQLTGVSTIVAWVDGLDITRAGVPKSRNVVHLWLIWGCIRLGTVDSLEKLFAQGRRVGPAIATVEVVDLVEGERITARLDGSAWSEESS